MLPWLIQLGYGAGQSSSPPEPPPQPEVSSGGFYLEYELYQAKRRKRRKEEEEAREHAEALAELDRAIALELRKQEEKDAERAELERLQALADRYAGTKQPVTRRVSASLLKAQEERTRNSLEQLQREMERMLEEDELSIMLILNQ